MEPLEVVLGTLFSMLIHPEILMLLSFAPQVPKLLDKQGGQLLAVAVLVFSRTWISDRIASLNGSSFLPLDIFYS
jgi:hypothetical protein